VTPWVRRLLIANIIVFFLQLTMPGITDAFAFVPAFVLRRPWTIVTYMFLHAPNNIMHIIFNMLGLFFFGPQVEERLGSQRFATLYFLSGISGAVLSFFLAPAAPIVGASAGVFGVMLAFAYFWPDTPIYIWGVLPVPARILVIVTTLLALWSGYRGSRGGVADFAHLGGYAGAYLYLKWLDRRTTRRREQVTARSAPPPPAIKNWRQVDMKSIHEVNRDEVNRILDKISASGIDSLTAQERTFLSNFVPPDDRVPPKT
jgi:membrane associated rhomboid family serine protease